MLEFFNGWRRKTGGITLVMALVLGVAWVRSLVENEYVALPFEIKIGNWLIEGVGTQEQALVLYGQDLTEPETEPLTHESLLAIDDSKKSEVESESEENEPADALSALSGSEAVADEWTAVGERASIMSYGTVFRCVFSLLPVPLVSVPFYCMAMPLTLLSAWLILRKSESVK